MIINKIIRLIGIVVWDLDNVIHCTYFVQHTYLPIMYLLPILGI